MNAEESELRERIKKLEAEKAELIKRITAVNGRLRYKKYEKKALEPFLQETRNVRIGPLKKKKSDLEFTISTEAYTPRQEKELLKEVKALEGELAKVVKIEKARRKDHFVSQDIADAEKEITVIEERLRGIREELKKLYEEAKGLYELNKKEMKIHSFKGGMPTLEDVGIIVEGKPNQQ